MSRLIRVGVNDRRLCQALNAMKTKASIDVTSNAYIALAWIKKSLEELRIQNDTLSGDELTRNQGACQTLQAFLDSLDVAQEILREN